MQNNTTVNRQNVECLYVKSSKMHLDNLDNFLNITRELQDCTTTDSCFLHLPLKYASLFLPSSSFDFLEILFKYSSAIGPQKPKCSMGQTDRQTDRQTHTMSMDTASHIQAFPISRAKMGEQQPMGIRQPPQLKKWTEQLKIFNWVCQQDFLTYP